MNEDSRLPLIEEGRAALQAGLAALDAQASAIVSALSRRMPAAGRRVLRGAIDRLARRIVDWQALMADEPELVARLEALAQRLRERPGSACTRGSGPCATRRP